eukprot:scaffold19.g1748.t1
MAAFLKELPGLIAATESALVPLLGAGPPLAARLQLRELQTTFVCSSVLAKRCRDLYALYVCAPADAAPGAPPSPLALLWLLFLGAKVALLPPLPELEPSHGLLLACAAFLLRNLPRAALTPVGATLMAGGGAPGGVLDALAGAHRVGSMHQQLRCLGAGLDEFLAPLLSAAGLQPGAPTMPPTAEPRRDGGVQASAPAAHAPPREPTRGTAARHWLVFPGLFVGPESAPVAAPEAVDALQRFYHSAVASHADVDERVLLPAAAALAGGGGPAAAAPAARPGLGPPAGGPACEGTPATPKHRGPGPEGQCGEGTPGCPFSTPPPRQRTWGAASGLEGDSPSSAALPAVAWLLDVAAAAHAPGAAPPALEAALQARGDQSLGPRLVAAAEAAAVAALPDDAVDMALHVAAGPPQVLRRHAVALYWRFLLSLAGVEATRSGGAHPYGGTQPAAAAEAAPAAALLACPPAFHRALLACAVECVAAAHRLPPHPLPSLLERLGADAYQVGVLAREVGRADPALPRELRRHLLAMEESVLESLAWQCGSSLYATLAAACGVPHGATMWPSSKGAAPDLAASAATGASAAAAATASTRGCQTAAARLAVGSKRSRDGTPAACRGGTPDPSNRAGSAALGPAQAPPRLPLSFGQPPGEEEAVGGAGAPQCDPAARAAADELLRRLLRLAAARLASLLCSLPGQIAPAAPGELLAQAYTLAHHAVYHHTWLLFGRHLDQLLLCSLYSARPETYKRVSMATREELHRGCWGGGGAGGAPVNGGGGGGGEDQAGCSDIIEFYNCLFIPNIRPFLLRLVEDPSLLAAPLPDRLVRLACGGGAPLAGMQASPRPSGLHCAGAPAPTGASPGTAPGAAPTCRCVLLTPGPQQPPRPAQAAAQAGGSARSGACSRQAQSSGAAGRSVDFVGPGVAAALQAAAAAHAGVPTQLAGPDGGPAAPEPQASPGHALAPERRALPPPAPADLARRPQQLLREMERRPPQRRRATSRTSSARRELRL